MANYPGLQYYGKGGTRWYAFWKPNAGKMDENKNPNSYTPEMQKRVDANEAKFGTGN